MRLARERAEAELRSPWIKPGALLFILAALMGDWWLARHTPGKTPPSLPAALSLATAGGVFFVYVVPWFFRFLPSQISIFDKRIARVIGNSATCWEFKNIDHCQVTSIALDGRVEWALLIHSVKGKRAIIGIPADLVPRATELLSGFNVRMEQGEQLPLLSDLLSDKPRR